MARNKMFDSTTEYIRPKTLWNSHGLASNIMVCMATTINKRKASKTEFKVNQKNNKQNCGSLQRCKSIKTYLSGWNGPKLKLMKGIVLA